MWARQPLCFCLLPRRTIIQALETTGRRVTHTRGWRRMPGTALIPRASCVGCPTSRPPYLTRYPPPGSSRMVLEDDDLRGGEAQVHLGHSPIGTYTTFVSRAVAWDLGPTPSKVTLRAMWHDPLVLVAPMTFSLVNEASLCPMDIIPHRYVPGWAAVRSTASARVGYGSPC